MNIKIDRDIHKKLLHYVEHSILFGNPNGADTDVLCILAPNWEMDYAITNTNHQLHYKEEDTKTDYLYTTPRALVRSIIFGENTINMELLMEGKFKDTPLAFLDEIHNRGSRSPFITKKTIRAFLGMSERDLKQAKGDNKEKKLKFAELYYNYVCVWLGLPIKVPNLDLTVGDVKDLRGMLESFCKEKGIPDILDPKIVMELHMRLCMLTDIKYLDIPELTKIYHEEV